MMAEQACTSVGTRVNAAPAWCNELAEEICEQHYVVNIHGSLRPCEWIDVGCRASETKLCDNQSTRANHNEGGGIGGFIGMLLFAIAVGVAFVLRKRLELLLKKIELPAIRTPPGGKSPGSSRRRDDEDEEEAGELLHVVEESGTGDAGLTLAAATALSADAAREAAVACAAAHALLASHAGTTLSSEPGEQTLSVDENYATTAEGMAAGLHTASDHDVATQPAEANVEVDEAKAPSGSMALPQETEDDSPELPSLSLRKSRAAFDSGELFEGMSSPATAHQDVDAANLAAAKPHGSGGDDDDDDDDGYNARPSDAKQWMPSNKTLAMSLD